MSHGGTRAAGAGIARRSPRFHAALVAALATAACGEPLSLSDRGCAADGDCVGADRCDLAPPGGRCRPRCEAGCASGDGCDRGFCVPGFTEGCEGCVASGYECRAQACVASATPVAVVTPAQATGVPGSRLVLDGSGSSSPVGEPLRYRWVQRLPVGPPDLLAGGASSPIVAVELPAAAQQPIVVTLTVTGVESGLSASAEAELTVATGALLAVSIEASHEDGTPVSDAVPATGGERLLLVATVSGGAGARIVSLATQEPAWIDEDPEPARFATTVPAGCLTPPLFSAAAVDDGGGSGSAQLLLPVSSPAPRFVLRSLELSPAADGSASVAVTGTVLDSGGAPAAELLASTRVFVQGLTPELQLQPGAAGSWSGVVPLPCAEATAGATAAAAVRIELDPGCGPPLVQREPFDLPRFPLVEGKSGVGSLRPTGTLDAPFRSLQRGIRAAAAAGCPLVALASGDHDPGVDLAPGSSLAVDRGVVLHGGHDPAAGWLPAGPTTVLLAAAGSVDLAAAGAGLAALTVDGDCGAQALVGVSQRALLEQVVVSRTGRLCVRPQQLVVLADGARLEATGCTLEAGAGPASTGILLGAGSDLTAARCDLTGGGPGFVGLQLADGTTARLEGSSVVFTGTLGDATGIHAGPGSTLTLVRSLVAADASASVRAVWVDGARAQLTDSALYGGTGDLTIGLFVGPGAAVEVYGGVLRGGAATTLAAGAVLDGGSLTVSRGDESPDAGSRAPFPAGVTSPTPLLSGGQAPSAVCVGLAECGSLTACASAASRPAELDVRRAIIAGVDYEDGVLGQTGVAVAVALASGRGRIEDSVLLSQATADSSVGQGAAVVSATGDGAGDLLVHDALVGPFLAQTSATALLTTHGTTGSNATSLLGCLLWSGLSPQGDSAVIRRDDDRAGPERVEASLFHQTSDAAALLTDTASGFSTADMGELNQLLSRSQPNGFGQLVYSFPPLQVSGCTGCADAGWDGGEEDGLDFYGAPRSGVPDVGPFEFP